MNVTTSWSPARRRALVAAVVVAVAALEVRQQMIAPLLMAR